MVVKEAVSMLQPMRKFIFFLFLVVPILSKGQIHINFGNINQNIPNFTFGVSDNVVGQILIKKEILKPIADSESAFEIRYFSDANTEEKTLVIKCSNNTIKADLYEAFAIGTQGIPKKVLADYKSLGSINGDTSIVVLYRVHSNIKPPLNYSWDQFIGFLIANHLFDLPDELVLNKIVRKDDHNAALMRECCDSMFELKVGNHFRNFSMLGYYGPTKRTKIYFQCSQNITKLILPLLNQ